MLFFLFKICYNVYGDDIMKKVVIDAEAKVVNEKRTPTKNNKLVKNKFIEWFIYMIGYMLVLIVVSIMSPSLYINLDHFGIYAFLGAIIIYVLNKTVKPILNILALPLTILSMGLFYLVINVVILRITSLLIGTNNFHITGIFGPLFVVIMISFLNMLMEGLVIKPFIKRNK